MLLQWCLLSPGARLPAAAANQLVPDDRGRGEWAAPRLAAALAAAAPARGDDAGEGSGRAAPAEDAPHPLARARSRSHVSLKTLTSYSKQTCF